MLVSWLAQGDRCAIPGQSDVRNGVRARAREREREGDRQRDGQR